MLCILEKTEAKSYTNLVQSVIERLDIGDVLRDARKILIKPNLVTAKTSDEGVTTNLGIVKAIVELTRHISNAQIVVGESSLLDTETVFNQLNIYDLVQAGCTVENFDCGQWVEVQPPFKLLFENILIPMTAYESDLIINVGKMKTHELTGVTLGIKNFFGLLSRGGRNFAHMNDINKGIVDVFSYFERNKRVVSILDALVALTGKRGPIIGKPVVLNRIIASMDTVQCDAAGIRMMGVDPCAIEHVRLAAEVFDISLDAANYSDAEMGPAIDFDVPAVSRVSAAGITRFADWLRCNVFYKYPVLIDSGLCVNCRRCERICPRQIVTVTEKTFQYITQNCVHCLCCVEACNAGAIGYAVKRKWLFTLCRQVWAIFKRIKMFLNQVLS